MGNYLNSGNDGFAAAVKEIYVDKTGMVSYINDTLGTLDKLTCVSRPRRFGKSIAAKMLCAYYDKSCDSRKLFDGLAISSIGSRDVVLTLIVHLGYLAYDAKEKKVFIPNEEVREEFVLAVSKGKHTEVVKLIQNYGGEIYLVGIRYDADTKKHICKIEKYRK